MAYIVGARTWDGGRDKEGYPTYTIVHRVVVDSVQDGPAVVLATAGLPQPGNIWAFGNDVDQWAWCLPDQTAKRASEIKEGHPGTHWDVTSNFSGKPVNPTQQRCNTTSITDPLLEPQKISGSFTMITSQATHDRFGWPINNSAHEGIKGQEVEFETPHTSVEIEQNVLNLDLPLLAYIQNNPLNSDYLWGVIPRGVKVTVLGWERKYYGSCYVYFTRKFRFDVNTRLDPNTGLVVSGWDKDVLDEGTKVLSGHWDTDATSDTYGYWVDDQVGGVDPDPLNPGHFKKFQDRDGNYSTVVLDGNGRPAGMVQATINTGPYIMSIVNGEEHEEINDLLDPNMWVKLVSDPTDIHAWEALDVYGNTKYYLRGALATHAGLTWVQVNPSSTPNAPGDGTDWISINVPPVNRGVYELDDYNTYDAGHYVETWQKVYNNHAGVRHIEKYGESNLLLLGIPIILI